MENIEIKIQGIEYYDTRLNFLLSSYRSEGMESLKPHLNIINTLIKDYKKFKFDPRYDQTLVEAVETWILTK